MSNFDLIDDYLTNRLSGNEQNEFERVMNADPTLKSEVDQQRAIVDGIRKARVAELKAILNNVQIGGGGSFWSGWSAAKIAATIGAAGIIGTGLYFYLKDSHEAIKNIPSAEIPMDSLLPKEEPNETVIEKRKDNSTEQGALTQRVKKPGAMKKESTSPKVEVVDPSEEMLSDNKANESASVTPKSGISVSTIQVERDTKNKQYSFHYQFSEGKLFLYGPFDETLYEILEVHGDNHALFLFFKENFFHLNEAKTEVTELSPIRDRSLIQKLKEFRNGK